MSKEEKYYSEKPMARTLEEIRKCAHKQSYSCVHASTFAECAIREYCSRRVTSNVKDNR